MRTAQADLSLRWAHMPFCWFCHVAAHILNGIHRRLPEPELFTGDTWTYSCAKTKGNTLVDKEFTTSALPRLILFTLSSLHVFSVVRIVH